MNADVQWYSSRVVVARATDRLADVAGEVAAHGAHYCAVVDESHRLRGVLRLIGAAMHPASQTRLLADLVAGDGVIPQGSADEMIAAFRDPARAHSEFAVVDADGHFLGLVTPESLFAFVLLQRDEARRAIEGIVQEQAQFDAVMQRKLEEAGQEALHRLNQGLASFSHDARSPLRSIQLFAVELLHASDTSLGPEGRYFAEAISRAAARLDALAAETLAKARDAATGAPARQEVSLREVVDDVLMLHQALLRETDATVQVRGELPRVLGAYVPLLQLVANLVSNAVTHVPAGRRPEVQIWADSQDGVAVLHVMDNGTGLPCDPPVTFAEFKPGAGSSGTGLGLAIVRAAAERIGARLEFGPVAHGGCDFRVELSRVS